MATSANTIELTDIPDETLRLLDARVRTFGGDRADYIRQLLNRDLHSPTLSELLAPFRTQVTNSEIDDVELHELFSDAREEVFAENHSRSK